MQIEMKAAVLGGIEDLKMVDIDTPTPTCNLGDILIKLEACAICKTDVKIFHAGHRDLKLPRVLGHEVATLWKIIGFHHDGGFAEYMLVPANGVHNGRVNKIPPSLSFEEASLAEPIACCINALKRCRVELGDVVAIFGAGPIGHLCAQSARLLGASEIIVIENSPQRIKFAEKSRLADVIIDCSDPVEALREETNSNGADVVIPACSVPEVPVQGVKTIVSCKAPYIIRHYNIS